MTGRKLFQLLKPVINSLSFVLSFLPRFLFEFTWPILELFPWRLGIFLRYLWAKRLAKSCGDNVLFETGVRVTYWEEIELGSNVAIFETCYLDGKGGIKIGNNVSIQRNVLLSAVEPIVIGNDVSIAHNVTILTSSHPFKGEGIVKKRPLITAPVSIGSDVWIGMNVSILLGCSIGDCSVIGAHSLVRVDVADGTVVGGVPARKIGDRF